MAVLEAACSPAPCLPISVPSFLWPVSFSSQLLGCSTSDRSCGPWTNYCTSLELSFLIWEDTAQ